MTPDGTRNTFSFVASLWKYSGRSAWYFITVPASISRTIRLRFKGLEHGWGSFPVQVTIGATMWRTSIFPEKKTQTYLLPIKKSVRRAAGLQEGDSISITIVIHI